MLAPRTDDSESASAQNHGYKPPLTSISGMSVMASPWRFQFPMMFINSRIPLAYAHSVPSHGELVMIRLRIKYADVLRRIIAQEPILGDVNNLLFASDVLVGGNFPHIVDTVMRISMLDRVTFMRFLIEYKEQSNLDGTCKKCAHDAPNDYFCKKCKGAAGTRNTCGGTCDVCGASSFLFTQRCLTCAAATAYF